MLSHFLWLIFIWMSSECIESFTATHLDTKDKESYCWLDITQPYEVSAGGYETENQPHDQCCFFVKFSAISYYESPVFEVGLFLPRS